MAAKEIKCTDPFLELKDKLKEAENYGHSDVYLDKDDAEELLKTHEEICVERNRLYDECVIQKRINAQKEELICGLLDNQPLTIDELDNMIREPIWDNKYKKWFLLREITTYCSTGVNELELIDNNGNRYMVEFEENRFYRKQM